MTYLWGPLSRLGLIVALVSAAIDQAVKLWLVLGFDLGSRGRVPITPFLDIVLIWNKGISYGLFQQDSDLGQWALLGIKIAAVILLWAWLSKAHTRLTAWALGLIIGGAVGNAIDRFSFGAVVDFVHLHLTTAEWHFSWYVFNLADVAIVAGVAVLLYESFLGDGAAKAPRSSGP
jgi:signal peptidase II